MDATLKTRLVGASAQHQSDKQRAQMSLSVRNQIILAAKDAGASYTEIAQVTGITRGGVQDAIARARSAAH